MLVHHEQCAALTKGPANHELAGLRVQVFPQSRCFATENAPRNRRAFRPTPTVFLRLNAMRHGFGSGSVCALEERRNSRVRGAVQRPRCRSPKRSESVSSLPQPIAFGAAPPRLLGGQRRPTVAG